MIEKPLNSYITPTFIAWHSQVAYAFRRCLFIDDKSSTTQPRWHCPDLTFFIFEHRLIYTSESDCNHKLSNWIERQNILIPWWICKSFVSKYPNYLYKVCNSCHCMFVYHNVLGTWFTNQDQHPSSIIKYRQLQVNPHSATCTQISKA